MHTAYEARGTRSAGTANASSPLEVCGAAWSAPRGESQGGGELELEVAGAAHAAGRCGTGLRDASGCVTAAAVAVLRRGAPTLELAERAGVEGTAVCCRGSLVAAADSHCHVALCAPRPRREDSWAGCTGGCWSWKAPYGASQGAAASGRVGAEGPALGTPRIRELLRVGNSDA